ncbi:MAG: hypothetical protein QOI45_1963 [Thermoleophilaceae bacterium]|nr:hypothetical protein [Thermoleophilaceae bacterium]
MSSNRDALAMVRLEALTERSSGAGSVGIGLVDGPVASDHPDFAGASIRPVAGRGAACQRSGSGACAHGTFVAGILVARRGSPAPSICPGCTLLVRPIFWETADTSRPPTATPEEVAQAIFECVDAGARIVNLSAATGEPTTRSERALTQALDHAAARGALVVAAAGNQGTLGSSAITRHPGVIPVVAYDRAGRPLEQSNLGSSPGRRGLGAPGDAIVSLTSSGPPVTHGGTSFAAAFVTGAIALLWSLFATVDAGRLRWALAQGPGRRSVVPPLLDAERAYATLAGQG